ncbi:hypothetical protein D1AOALGA4SA_12582 [Olavius algarvensis Delta 1 endosymbiont]|nr:hypothetical protein D1AOALGA4SA_12582 [Olavius algarvensis Delta 1 endosymbiont]
MPTAAAGQAAKSIGQEEGVTFEETPMKEILIMLAIVGVWFLLQAYILPKLGVST